MSVLNKYKKRLKQTTLTPRQEMINNYEYYLEHAPNKFEYKIKNTEYTGCFTMIDSNKGNEGTRSDNKFITVPFDSKIRRGDNLVIDDERVRNHRYWQVADEEMLGVASYRKFMIRPCNKLFKIKVDNIVYEIPAFLTNKTLYTSGLKYETEIVYTDAVMTGTMAVNEPGIEYIKEGVRYVMEANSEKRVYKITTVDTLTPGMLNFRSGSETRVPEDDLENDIAFNLELENFKKLEFEIVGDHPLEKQAEYKISPTPNDNYDFKFELEDDDGLVDIEILDKTCILTPKKKGWVTLKAICEKNDIRIEKNILCKG